MSFESARSRKRHIAIQRRRRRAWQREVAVQEREVAAHQRKVGSIRYQLRQALSELLAEHKDAGMLPTSARFLFYELVQRGVISKHATGGRRADQNMIDALTSLREDGTIPWDWIVDETRAVSDYTGYESVKAGLTNVVDQIKLDPWNKDAPLILTESRSLAGVLRSLCGQYRVIIAPTNGQAAGFLHTKVAELSDQYSRVLYLGDFDLAGGDIENNTRRVLEHEVGNLGWERLALTAAQVEEYNLPVIEKYDRRFTDGGKHDAVETEALSQAVIVQIVQERLDELLPEPLEAVQEREQAQQESLKDYLNGFEPE